MGVRFNACTDLIVRGTELLEALDVSPSLARDHSALHSVEDLQQAFAHFFSHGPGAERPFLAERHFVDIVEKARSLSSAQWSVGGNAALIAQKMSEISPNTQIELIAPVGPKLQQLLNTSITVPASSLSHTDPVHLIMEYEVGETWGGYTATVASRFITSHDLPNSEARYMEAFFQAAAAYQPHLIIFSGLHMLEGQEEAFWRQRITILGDLLQTLTRSQAATQTGQQALIHLELASMSNDRLLKAIAGVVFSRVDAIGLNDQELAFLTSVESGPHSDRLSSQHNQLLIHQVSEVLAWMLETYGRTSSSSTRRLTRVHFHSLAYHIIATIPGYWTDSLMQAVAAGTEVAGKQACDLDELDAEKLELKLPHTFKLHREAEPMSLDPQAPVIRYTYRGVDFVFSPVLVCKKPLKTVGLGDAISATGLLYSRYRGSPMISTD